MAKTTTSKKVSSITVRMYRMGGTGDFFLLLFKTGSKVTFKMMIDCGCIQANKNTFDATVADLETATAGVVDLLVVTHEHADHINGFEKAAKVFDRIKFKKVWLAWTENTDDQIANDYRQNHTKIRLAISKAVQRLQDNKAYFKSLLEKEYQGPLLLEGVDNFVTSLANLNALNATTEAAVSQSFKAQLKALKDNDQGVLNLDPAGLPTLEDYLRDCKVIKADTVVEFLNPGDLFEKEVGAEGIRFFVLGPPRDPESLNLTERDHETYEQRKTKSSIDLAFTTALMPDDQEALIFESEHDWSDADSQPPKSAPDDWRDLQTIYKDDDNNAWRRIDYDWLASTGGVALRYEQSINNTSLALAIQFADSERVLLFPGDAELGNWSSWHRDEIHWSLTQGERTVAANATYLLSKTVFYKVGHHLSQNGTAKIKGVELMPNKNLTAMATLDFSKILSGWLNTMPNDLLGAELLRRTEGRLFFTGDRQSIVKNIQTDRVAISQAHLNTLEQLNKPFDQKPYVQVVIKAN